MAIGTALFNKLNMQALNRISGGIADLQGQISSGKADRRPSVDPVGAMRLNAGKEQQQLIERFSGNLQRAQARLDQADGVLDETVNVLQRLGELALRANSDTVTFDERKTLKIEALELRQALLDQANAQDDTGQALFAGYRSSAPAFVETPDGIAYQGDGGRHMVQVSESASLPTSLSGDEVFVNTPGGNVFQMVDDFINALSVTGDRTRDTATAELSARLDLDANIAPQSWSMMLTGPDGQAEVTFDMAFGAMGGAVQAINDQTAATGITATLSADGTGIELTSSGEITVAQMRATPDTDLGASGLLTDAEGQEFKLVAPERTMDAQITRLRQGAFHMADQRARLGAMSANAAGMDEVMSARKLVMDKLVSGLEDLDLASAITKLQQDILTRDASQQAYVKITQKTLFDYLR